MQPALPFRFQSEHTALGGSCDFLPEANSAHRGRNENWTSSPRAEKTKGTGLLHSALLWQKSLCPKGQSFFTFTREFWTIIVSF